jgi:hypothetical protein
MCKSGAYADLFRYRPLFIIFKKHRKCAPTMCAVHYGLLTNQRLFQNRILPKNIANQAGFLLDWKANNWYR